MPEIIRIARWLGIAALIMTYPTLMYFANTSILPGVFGAILALMPVSAISLALAWRSRQRVWWLALLGLTGAAAWSIWPVIEHHSGLIFWIQHAGIQLILLITFGRSLLAGREPLCTQFATIMQGPLTPKQQYYTFQVTRIWTLFFALMVITSTMLFFLAPLAVWSFFANFFTLPLVALIFIIEYWVRKRVFPDMPHGHILDAVKTYLHTSTHPH